MACVLMKENNWKLPHPKTKSWTIITSVSIGDHDKTWGVISLCIFHIVKYLISVPHSETAITASTKQQMVEDALFVATVLENSYFFVDMAIFSHFMAHTYHVVHENQVSRNICKTI